MKRLKRLTAMIETIDSAGILGFACLIARNR